SADGPGWGLRPSQRTCVGAVLAPAARQAPTSSVDFFPGVGAPTGPVGGFALLSAPASAPCSHQRLDRRRRPASISSRASERRQARLGASPFSAHLRRRRARTSG